MNGGADWSRMCEGCANVMNEPTEKGVMWARCFAPGPREGYVVGNVRFLPYVPAWCPLMQENETNDGTGKQG